MYYIVVENLFDSESLLFVYELSFPYHYIYLTVSIVQNNVHIYKVYIHMSLLYIYDCNVNCSQRKAIHTC